MCVLGVIEEVLCGGTWAHIGADLHFPGSINVLASFLLQALTSLLLHIGFVLLYCREGQRVRTGLWQVY